MSEAQQTQAQPMMDTVVVDNPAEYAERLYRPRIEAARTLKGDPLAHMHSRGQLGPLHGYEADKTHARLDRGRLFQSTWEASGRDGRIKSMDFIGGDRSNPANRSGYTDRQRRAGDQIRRWEKLLGEGPFKLLVLILVHKHTVAEAARIRHGIASKANVTYAGRLFRECLDEL